MSDASLNLQKAIYSALNGDAALTALVSGIFDFVPENKSFPWVMIGDDTLVDWNTMDFYGKEATITIHSWSRQQGRAECKTIMGHIQRILNGSDLVVTAAIMVFLQLEFENSMVDPDGVTYHGVQRFRALIQEG